MKSRLFIFALIIAGLLGLSACSSTTPDQYSQAKMNFAEQNYHDAYQQLLIPAAKGNPDAEYALGFLYYYGKGTPQNHTLGKQWILKAAQDGNEQAAQAYQMIMSQEQSIMPAEAVAPKRVYHPKIIQRPKTVIKARKEQPKKVSVQTHTKTKHSLLTAKATNYTLQLLDASSAAYAQNFIDKYKLSNKAHYFHRNLNGKDLYVVVYGVYTDKAAAIKAVSTLPSSIQKLRPWARQLSDVQAEIRSA